MSKNNEQFNLLIAQIIIQGNKMLGESNLIPPFGIMLKEDLSFELISNPEPSKSYSESVDILQERLKAKVQASSYLAGSIIYADYENYKLVAFLEDINNFCLKVVLPVKVDNGLSINADEMRAEEGGIFIFPVIN